MSSRHRPRRTPLIGALAAGVAVGALMATLGTTASGLPDASRGASPIPNGRPTVLPAFIGHAAHAHPIPAQTIPQNPFLAPNPFSNEHNDTWESDSYAIPGPLGRKPTVLSSTLPAARTTKSPIFQCGALNFDRHGRIETACLSPQESRLVLVDPVFLRVLTSFPLPSQQNPNGALGSAYVFLDNQDEAVLAAGPDHIWVVAQTGPTAHPVFTRVNDYNLSAVVGTSSINSMMPDWSGRLWFVVRSAGIVGVLDRATGAVHTLKLKGGIDNSFAVAQTASYIVTDKRMYAIAAGGDGIPYIVWSAPYQNTGKVKPGQYSAGSGTTPTVLGGGKYVAIADNARQMHIVVYRTAPQLSSHQHRIVCQVPVFAPGRGAAEDSLNGSGRSLIVDNNYGYTVKFPSLASTPSVPGVARVDINVSGTGCRLVWTNRTVMPASQGSKVSTKTGLVYVYARKKDLTTGVWVWYWTAIDFRSGRTVWERMAGTGRFYDAYWQLPVIGPTATAYMPTYAGIAAIRDTRR